MGWSSICSTSLQGLGAFVVYVAAASILTVTTPQASGAGPNLDFGIVDEAGYQQFVGAIRSAEYVRYDYAIAPKPRVAAATAGLLAFATRNPLADEADLMAFLGAYDAAMQAYDPSPTGSPNPIADPDLVRAENFLPAARFSLPLNAGVLPGFDSDVGEEALLLLGLSVPAPLDYNSMKSRVESYESARIRRLANAMELADLLVVGFMGRDCAGPRSEVLPVLQAYLESNGFEPAPLVPPARFAPVDAALAQLPATFAAYDALLNSISVITMVPGDLGGMDALFDAFDAIELQSELRLAGVVSRLANEPTLLEARLADVAAETALYQANLDQVAGPRAAIAANTFFLLQRTEFQDFASCARQYGSLELYVNEDLATAELAVNVAIGVGAIAAGNPVLGVSALSGAVFESLDLFGVGGPSPEEQILDALNQISMQITDLSNLMNDRFNRIETQLGTIYIDVISGLNFISGSVATLNADLIAAQASLDRIEEALYRIANSIIEADVSAQATVFLNSRGQGPNFPYSDSSGEAGFIGAWNDMLTYTTITIGGPAYGGPPASVPPDASLDLAGPSIGSTINALSDYVGFSTVAPPGPWAHGASAVAQLIRENPWYFAYLLEQPAGIPEFDQMLGAGASVTTAAATVRSSPLFDQQFDVYRGEFDNVFALNSAIDPMLPGYLSEFLESNALRESGLEINPFAVLGLCDQPDMSNTLLAENLEPAVIPHEAGIERDIVRPAPNSAFRILPQMPPETSAFLLMTEFHRQNGNLVSQGGSVPEYSLSWRTVEQLPESGQLIFAVSGTGPVSTIPWVRSVLVSVTQEQRIFSSWINTGPYSGWQTGAEFLAQTGVLEFIMNQRFYSDSAAPFSFTVPNPSDPNNLRFRLTVDGTTSNQVGDCAYILFGSMLRSAQPLALEALGERVASMSPTEGAEAIVAINSIELLAGFMDDDVALIDAMATLGVPDALRQSSVLRAGLRAAPNGELLLSGDAIRPGATPAGDFYRTLFDDAAAQIRAGGPAVPLSVPPYESIFTERADIIQSEINLATASYASGHGYLEWMIAELGHLSDNRSRLAVDDAYQLMPGLTLVVDQATGVLANDIDHGNRTDGTPYQPLRVDTGAAANCPVPASFGNPVFDGVPPSTVLSTTAGGTVAINADGSFTYDPVNASFVGDDTFTYRAITEFDLGDASCTRVFSLPATVMIRVRGDVLPPSCPCDWDDNANLNSDDFFAFLTDFFAGSADFDNNGTTNSDDFFSFLNCFFTPPAGC